MAKKQKMIRTGISGLDRLLGGGIVQRRDSSPCILLKGNPGCGKTTLALQIALNTAALEQGVSIVFSAEQRVESLRAKIERLQLNTDTIRIWSGTQEDLQKAAKSKRGALFLLSASMENITVLSDSLISNICEIRESVVKKRQKRNSNVNCVVLDSLTAVKGRIERDNFLVLASECGKNSDMSILIDEEDIDKEQSVLREYISDVVIRVGCRHRTAKKEYLERCLEILKARDQFHYRGKHAFSIKDPAREKQIGRDGGIVEKGICIYPSMGARLAWQLESTVRNSGTVKLRKGNEAIFGLTTLDNLLFVPENGRKPISSQKPGLTKGIASNASILLIGERGTKKGVLGLHFLAAGLDKEEAGLLLSLKDDPNTIRATASLYGALKSLIVNDKGIQIKHVRPSYMTPGRFLDMVRRWLDESEANGQSIQRVVFDNIAQIRLRFPLLDADPMFIPTLIDYFKARPETLFLLIDTVQEPERLVWEYQSPVLDLADYVIATQHLPFLGSDHTVITVRRSSEGLHSMEPAEICRKNRELVINDQAFEGITGVLTKNPEPVEIFLRLFHENSAQRRFNDEIMEEFSGKYKRKVHISSFSRVDSATEYDRMKRYWIESPSSIVKVVSLDQYWVRFAAEEGILWKFDPSWIQESQDESHLEKSRSEFLEGCLSSATIDEYQYAIPHYLDFGLFCFRKDLLKEFWGEESEAPDSFEQMIEMLTPMIEQLRHRGLHGFAFDMEAEESFVCTFLEFLFNMRAGDHKLGKRFEDISGKNDCEPPIIHDDDIKNGVREVLRTLRYLASNEILMFPCTLEHCKKSVFSRHWYSTVQFTCLDGWHELDDEGKLSMDNEGKPVLKKGYEKARLSAEPFPSLGVGVKQNHENSSHYSCSGSWYLGILRESLRPRLGYHLIEELTSVCKNNRRFEMGAGFPARRSFYKFHRENIVTSLENLTYGEVEGAVEGIDKCPRRLCKRESFCGNSVKLYRRLRPKIASIIFRTIEGSIKPSAAANEVCRQVRKEYKSLK